MNYRKLFFALIWIIVCMSGAAINNIMPQDAQYLWGTFVGCLSMVFARLTFEGDDE